jgi:squalene-hopene/tetraprenyl-beta-curcumene cyclase
MPDVGRVWRGRPPEGLGPTAPDLVPGTVAAEAPGEADALYAKAAAALSAAVEHLRCLQDEHGWWKGELETNVTMDAEDLLLRQFLGILRPDQLEESARWIRSQQRADGSWATFYGGPGELSTTGEAWVALRLAGDPPDAPHMAKATEFILANGGVESTRVFTRIWLALFGLWSWDDLPIMPPEMIFLPKWFPLNIYNWGCWARQTVVPLTIVNALRPVRPLQRVHGGRSDGQAQPIGIDEIRAGGMANRRARLWTWEGLFKGLDRLLHAYSRHPIGPLRRRAIRRSLQWILARQEADGGWGGIQPPWVYSLLALHLSGYPLDHPAVRRGLDGLEGFLIREQNRHGRVRRLEACQSPVWDTALAVTALLDAGVPAADPSVIRAAGWLLDEEIRVRGDWAVRRPRLAPGGWAFEFANDCYPDTDDTAEVVLGLRRVATGLGASSPAQGSNQAEPAALRAAIDRGVSWTVGMQSSDGGWGAFDADNTKTLAIQLPFCDFGAVIDPPSADVTAHIVEMLAAEGLVNQRPAKRGIRWLLDRQEPDGSWFGRWGANYVYGTGAVVPALVAAGTSPSAAPIRRAVRWLEEHQNPNGGWGEDLRSYRDRSWAGRGTSTASQTAWALLALLAVGEAGSESARRGVEWLCDTQRSDGTWDEPEFTGTGFPGDFYINYHLYRLVFPVSALGRYVTATSRAPESQRGTNLRNPRAEGPGTTARIHREDPGRPLEESGARS